LRALQQESGGGDGVDEASCSAKKRQNFRQKLAFEIVELLLANEATLCPHSAGGPGGALVRSRRIQVPLPASAPLNGQAGELLLEDAVGHEAEPVQLVIVEGLFAEVGVDPGE
jgi:hypothetical protein